jgi:uncharacterized protein (DUF1810 family)
MFVAVAVSGLPGGRLLPCRRVSIPRNMISKDGPTAEADLHDLARFVSAQAEDFATALAEISAGRKTSHWMWYIFPQFDGLGFSAMSKQYAIRSAAEARAYLAHPLLGPRLVRCCVAALEVEGKSAREIFGSPDDMKLRSSATLFASVSPPGSVFEQVLVKYFEDQRDPKTLSLLAAADPGLDA